MSLSVLINLSLLLALGAAALFISRAGLIVLLLLPGSQMLGFVDPMAIAAKQVFDIHALIALIVGSGVIFSLNSLRDLWQASMLKPMMILGLFWAFGVIYPVVNESSSLFYSLKASKEFLTVFSYFAVFLFLRTQQDIRWGWHIIIGLGFYYCVLEALSQLFGEALLATLTFDYRREGTIFWKVYLAFWPVLVISMLTACFEMALKSSRPFVRLGLGSLGLLLTFYRSYVLGVLAAIPVVLIVSKQKMVNLMSLSLILLGCGLLVIVIVAELFAWTHGSLEDLADKFFLSGITELRTQQGGALQGREVFAKERRAILAQSPYLGYGFIDKDSKAGLAFRREMKGDLLGFIDKGDLDVALKFGQIGRIILYGTFTYICYKLVWLARRSTLPSFTSRPLAIASLIVVYLLVQPVHAPLTYSFGLLPLGIALGLIDREHILLQEQVGA